MKRKQTYALLSNKFKTYHFRFKHSSFENHVGSWISGHDNKDGIGIYLQCAENFNYYHWYCAGIFLILTKN